MNAPTAAALPPDYDVTRAERGTVRALFLSRRHRTMSGRMQGMLMRTGDGRRTFFSDN